MDDIVPSLLEKIQAEFERQFNADRELGRMYGAMKSKTLTYADANTFAIRLGEILASSFNKYITVDSLPEGKMWYNIATRILAPTFHTNYSLICDICNAAQSELNSRMKLGLGVQTPDFDEDRLKNFINKVSNAESFEDIQWMLDEPVVNFSQSIVDEFIRTNAEFHYQSGLTPKIRRTLDGRNPCAWCKNLAGTYDYPYVPRDVYRKHERCRCVVEYIEDGKYVQNVHDKTWKDGNEPPNVKEKRIEQEHVAQIQQEKRRQEAVAVARLMQEHPDWSKEGATIYYRTQTRKR